MSDPVPTAGLACPECARLRALLDAQDHRMATLEAHIRDLQAQLNRNASNSSIPPSANPPAAPKPVAKAPTGRKPGGQPGHRGHYPMFGVKPPRPAAPVRENALISRFFAQRASRRPEKCSD